MKINPSNFLQINKTGHNLLSIFVVLSLIFNPLLPHIPVAEAATNLYQATSIERY